MRLTYGDVSLSFLTHHLVFNTLLLLLKHLLLFLIDDDGEFDRIAEGLGLELVAEFVLNEVPLLLHMLWQCYNDLDADSFIFDDFSDDNFFR